MAHLPDISKRISAIYESLLSEEKVKGVDDFSSKIGVTRATGYNILKGSNASLDLILALCEQFNVSVLYLLEGIGEMYRSDYGDIKLVPKEIQSIYPLKVKDKSFIDGLGTAQVPFLEKKDARGFEVSDDGMTRPSHDGLHPGDWVFCTSINKKELDSIVRQGYVYVIVVDDGCLVRRLYKDIGSDYVTVKGDNENVQPFNLKLKAINELWYCHANFNRHFPHKTNLEHKVAELELMVMEVLEKYGKG